MHILRDPEVPSWWGGWGITGVRRVDEGPNLRGTGRPKSVSGQDPRRLRTPSVDSTGPSLVDPTSLPPCARRPYTRTRARPFDEQWVPRDRHRRSSSRFLLCPTDGCDFSEPPGHRSVGLDPFPPIFTPRVPSPVTDEVRTVPCLSRRLRCLLTLPGSRTECVCGEL